jgi:hypothetical protein
MDSQPIKFDAELLQARWVLGGITPVELVPQAILALEAGFSGSALRQIADLTLPSRDDLGTLPERAFEELGLAKVDRDQAIALVIERGIPFSHPLIFEITKAFPEFAPRWKEHVAYWQGHPAGAYLDLAEFVHFVVEDLYDKGGVQEVQRTFDFMELALVTGNEDTKGLVSLGFFETLQCVASWRPYGQRAFAQFLGPNSRKVWEELHIVWQGKSSLADVIRAEIEEK